MAALYYIDGYNVIHKSTYLRNLFHGDIEVARNAFIDMLAQFCGTTDSRVRLMFDGRGEQRTVEQGAGGDSRLEVIYSSRHHDADALIERAIYTAKNPRDIIVVTADRGVRDFCMRLNALVMTPDAFLETVRTTTEEVARSGQERHTQSMGSVEDRLSDTSMESLKRLRDRLK